MNAYGGKNKWVKVKYIVDVKNDIMSVIGNYKGYL